MSIILSVHNVAYENMKYKDINIEKNKITFITGESGTGKSTLLKLYNQTVSHKDGVILYNGVDVNKYSTIVLRQQVLLVSQFVFIYDNMSIKENFEKFYECREIECISENDMTKFLKLCCIDFELSKDCTMMSGGERQRIYTAIFMSFMPKVLMLDEPTSALDSNTSHEFMKNICDFCKEKEITLLVVSHDKQIVSEFSESVIEIKGDK